MNASTNYDILTTIRIADQATASARQITASTTGMTGSMLKAVTAGNLFSSAIQRGFAVADRAVVNLTRMIVGLNREFEDQAVAIGVLVNAYRRYEGAGGIALTPSENFRESIGVGGRQIGQFEQAERTMPASKETMAQIAQVIMPQYLAAGGQLGQELTDLVAKAGTVAGALSLRGEGQAPQELLRMLMGRGRAGQGGLMDVLELQPEALKAMPAADRLKAVQEALDRIVTPETLQEMNSTFTVVKRHVDSFIGDTLRIASSGAFKRYTGALQDVNAYFDRNTPVLTEATRAAVEFGAAAGGMLIAPLADWVRRVGRALEAVDPSGVAAISAFADSVGPAIAGFRGASAAVDAATGSTTDMVGTMRTATIAVAVFSAQIGALVDMIAAFSPAGLPKDIADIIAQGSLGLTDRLMGRANENWKAAGEAVDRLRGNVDAISGRQIIHAPAEAARRAQEIFDHAYGAALKVPRGGEAKDVERNRIRHGRGATPEHVTNIGSQTINMNNQFKENADPDRIAFKVKEIFQKIAERPTTSRKRFRIGVN